jgi:beta-glucosidase
MKTDEIRRLIGEMTLEEKVSLCSGKDMWRLKGLERLGIPSIAVSDGPHGLRKQDGGGDNFGMKSSGPAVCFPTAAGLAATFNRELLYVLGRALAGECQAMDVQILLGPAVNIKRSPLCGRNFEYFSEDPYLTGELAAQYTMGMQDNGVGVSVKHFAANNQETRRFEVSANVCERALREIYLPAFEAVVKKARPWTVMSSYNRVNGKYVQEDRRMLTDILRGEWGFDGFVMSDWTAVDDRIASLCAGQELEMPGNGGINDKRIAEAVRSGVIGEEVLDTALERMLPVLFKIRDGMKPGAVFDGDRDHDTARQIALESMVLLKNEDILPLRAGQKIVFIGEFAVKPRYQGGGSSHVHSYKVDNALEAAAKFAAVRYSPGYRGEDAEPSESLIAEAAALAKTSDVAVIFAGIPSICDTEGQDRKHIDMPQSHNTLIEAVSAVQPNTVIVLHNGAPVTMPWLNNVKGVLESYLAGEAAGSAQADILFGKANPSGKLAETFPVKLPDTPPFFNFPGHLNDADYSEGVFVGYRYYATKEMEVLFPFGHGLSYTTFAYSDMTVSAEELSGDDELMVEFTVKNTGERAGKETAQLYISPKTGGISRPVMELKGFEKTEFQPGEEKRLRFTLTPRAFAYYDEGAKGWVVENGEYEVRVGKSSRDIALRKTVCWNQPPISGWRVDRNTLIGDLLAHPITKTILEQAMQNMNPGTAAEEAGLSGDFDPPMVSVFFRETPLRNISFYIKALDEEKIGQFIQRLNRALAAGETGTFNS